jgi:hypothetical protein
MSVGELQLLICGTPTIDLAGWRASTEYAGGYTEATPVVAWFWAAVEAMDVEQCGKLLHFCTGSTRVPATGFTNLQGYGGAQHRFRISRDDRGPGMLPTASTCFNTLRLPEYGSADELQTKLAVSLAAGLNGFDEGAVGA